MIFWLLNWLINLWILKSALSNFVLFAFINFKTCCFVSHRAPSTSDFWSVSGMFSKLSSSYKYISNIVFGIYIFPRNFNFCLSIQSPNSYWTSITAWVWLVFSTDKCPPVIANCPPFSFEHFWTKYLSLHLR